MLRNLVAALAAAAAVSFALPANAGDIIDNWANVKAPPAPELKAVAIDGKTTALLVFDTVKPFCNAQRYTGCPPMLPTLKKLIADARAKGVMVIYTSVPPVAKTEIVDDIAPAADDHFVQSWTDKFLNTDLEKTLKDRGISTVIVTGLASNGAVIETSSEAALKGFSVVVVIDVTTALTPYAEQFTAWQLANGPIISPKITLTKTDVIKF